MFMSASFRKQENTHCQHPQPSVLVVVVVCGLHSFLSTGLSFVLIIFFFCCSGKVLCWFYSIIPPTFRHPFFLTQKHTLWTKSENTPKLRDTPSFFYTQKKKDKTTYVWFFSFLKLLMDLRGASDMNGKETLFWARQKRGKKESVGSLWQQKGNSISFLDLQ